MTTYEELDCVTLLRDIPGHPLRRGMVGAVVGVVANSARYEVEFVAPDGGTIDLLTVDAADLALHSRAPSLASHAK